LRHKFNSIARGKRHRHKCQLIFPYASIRTSTCEGLRLVEWVNGVVRVSYISQGAMRNTWKPSLDHIGIFYWC